MQYWFIFYKDNLLLEKVATENYTIPCMEKSPITLPPNSNILAVAPDIDGIEVKTCSIDETTYMNIASNANSSQYEFCGLRKSYYKLTEPLYLKAGKCRELLYWDAGTHFCGVCGSPMKMHTAISKKCTTCGKEVWPQLSTAIIVLISRGDEVLLVHAHNFVSNFYGLIAGFVETGETLEEAVIREVKEETSLTIKNIRYYASQPWPYPCGLMVGFYAEYVSGDIHLQTSELGRGAWFHRDNLPQIPEKLSLARRLIDHWLESFPTKQNEV